MLDIGEVQKRNELEKQMKKQYDACILIPGVAKTRDT
jgi:hypothetical protein